MNLQKKIGFILEWNFLLRGDIMVRGNVTVRDAEYFRKLQSIKSVEERVNDDVEFTLNIIELHISKGNKLPYLLLTFYSSSESHSMALVKRLKNLGFKVYNKILTPDGEFKCCIDWSE